MAKRERGTPGIDLDQAKSEIRVLVDDAQDFVSSEMEEDWALAERYYNGETDLPIVENRSNVVKTEVRDAIRNTMPSIMRTLLHAREPVTYIPSSIMHAPWVSQQAQYVRQVFFANNGYMQLYSAILEALKLKIGPIKVSWDADPTPEYQKFTKVPFTIVQELIADPLFEVDDFTQVGDADEVGPELYDVSGERLYENGRIRIQSVPNYEFFISRNCNSIEMALEQGTHGHSTIVSVSEAMEMGLDYGDWLKLDAEDPEQSDFTDSSAERRGYTKDAPNDPVASVDVLSHKFKLTEAYVMYDLKGTGRRQIYRFYFGGSSNKYIHHEQVEDSEFALVIPIPIPHTAYGHSIADLTVKEQDTSTSLLRATVDNAHASNNPRVAADPNKTNFEDLMNPAIGAPIRKRSGDTIQPVVTPFTGQGLLGLLQYLDMDTQNKVGVTKAAQGLDPDAMQSTDKDAVMNTIMTSQGQTELMVRNIVESALIRVFKMVLKLATRHYSPQQTLMYQGHAMPINIKNFDTDAIAQPNVGLGTASPQQKQAALNMILQRQEAYMKEFGPNNPFTSYAKIYNTLEDLLDSVQIPDASRYFNVVTPAVEKKWGEARQKQMQEQQALAQKNQPMDPSKAYIQVEKIKAQSKAAETAARTGDTARKLELDALAKAEELDIKRDQMVQDRVVEFTKIGATSQTNSTKEEQKSNERISTKPDAGGSTPKAVGRSGPSDKGPA